MRAMLRVLGSLFVLLAMSLPLMGGDMSPHRSGFVKADGVRLHYLEWSGGRRGGVAAARRAGPRRAHLRRPPGSPITTARWR